MKKELAICLFFFLIFFNFGYNNFLETGHFSETNDYFFHFYKSNGDCFTKHYTQEACDRYPKGFEFLTSNFTNNEITFNLFALAIICFIIPLAIFTKTKSIWSIIIYFSSSFVFNVFYASIFAQAMLSLIFCLILRSEKINMKDPILLIASTFFHSKAIYVLIPVLLYKLSNKINFLKQKNFPYVYLDFSTMNVSNTIKLGAIINWFYSLKLDDNKKLLILFFIIHMNKNMINY